METIELVLSRETFHDRATLGRIFQNLGDLKLHFLCYTLEDKDRGLTSTQTYEQIRREKVFGETAIPIGRYKIIKAFSPKHKRVMPLLLDVPGFTGVEMHGGNTVADSLGCILCAHTQDVANDRIQGKAEDSIMDILNQAEADHKEVWITIKK